MEKMPWFTSKGQIIQTVVPTLGFLLALLVAWKSRVFQGMSENQFFSAGAILFYVLIAITLISLWRTARMMKGRSPLNLSSRDNLHEEQKQSTHRESRQRFAEPWLRQREFQSALKALGGGEARVTVVYADERDRSFVDCLYSAFERSGWKITIIPPASYGGAKVDGLHVRGYEGSLVNSIARAFEKTDILGVKKIVDASEVSRDDPKWNAEQRSLRIIIGE